MLASASLHRGHMDTSGIELPSRRTRRRHAPEFREQVVQACQQPGVSIAAVALANGLNANMVHAWRRQDREVPTSLDTNIPAPAPQFIALPLPASAAGALPDICIELRRGATTVSVTWPGQAAGECGAWLREWLR